MNQVIERAFDDNPLCQAWHALTGKQFCLESIRLPVLAKIVIHNHKFHPLVIGSSLFRACVDEIINDSDTYPGELQIWAESQLERYRSPVAFGD